jgi:hypothetical protein
MAHAIIGGLVTSTVLTLVWCRWFTRFFDDLQNGRFRLPLIGGKKPAEPAQRRLSAKEENLGLEA